MEYKQGVHGFLYYKTHDGDTWRRSCENEPSMLATVDRKLDPMAMGDDPVCDVYPPRTPREIAISVIAYVKWRGGYVSPESKRCTLKVSRSDALKMLGMTPAELSTYDLPQTTKGGNTFYKLTDIKALK